MIRVGLDARYGVLAQRRGIGVYVYHLLDEWRRARPADLECVAFTDGRADPAVVRQLSAPGLQFVRLDARPYFVWEQRAWPDSVRRHRCDVVHGTANIAPPVTGVPVVLTLHDVIEWHRGRDFPDRLTLRHRISRAYRMRAMALGARAARALITVSGHARRDIAATLGINPDRIQVIGLGADPPSAVAEEGAAATLGVRTPYALALGALDARKNMDLLWRVFEGSGELHAVLVGFEPGALRQAAVRAASLPRVTVLGFVPDDVMAELLRGSSAFLYPSRYEGFGLPALDAMAAGIPTLVAAGTATDEVTHGGALALPPRDPDAWRDALERVARDPAFAAALAAQGRARASDYRWDATAAATWEVYRRAASAG